MLPVVDGGVIEEDPRWFDLLEAFEDPVRTHVGAAGAEDASQSGGAKTNAQSVNAVGHDGGNAVALLDTTMRESVCIESNAPPQFAPC